MTASEQAISARERIVETAYGLFYRQGYKATGINQVIEASGVAKATFYHHFPSKEDLGVAYVRERNRRELGELRDMIGQWQDPRERFLAPMAILVQWIQDTGYQGCPFQNIVIEFLDPQHPVHQEVARNREQYRDIFRNLAVSLKASSPRYRSLDPEHLSQTYMILVEGSVMLAVIQHNPQPIKDALQTLIRLIDHP
jgi:AcrR family transcriptional regulator